MSRTALITGGEGTLARALHAELESHGYTVAAPGRTELDVTSTTSVQAWFETHPEPPDLLILSAGIIDDQLLSKLTPESFDTVLDVNLTGAFRVARAALCGMAKRRSGHVIWIGSHSALTGPIGQAHYAAAKAALTGLGKSLAKEFGSRNIRFNGVLPGLLETRMTEKLLSDPDRRQRTLADHALGRLNTVQDAARFIAFLDTMEHVSGQVFQLDSRVGR